MTEGIPGFDGAILDPADGHDNTEQRFSPDPTMQAAIDAALAKLEDDERGAVVGYADLSGARLVAMAKLGDGWSFVGIVDREWQGDLRAGAQVRFSWK